MTANEIRKKFLEFFASRGHRVIDSDSLVPKDDPTVLFTTAGMQQFKRQFLGFLEDYTKAATCQKCLRTDDLDKVGKTDGHHTFFEMLGNFSFGDYFKKEAITWAWEFFTLELKIPGDKLWVSVYKDDDEAYNIWIKDIKIDPKRIVKLGDKSNFWPSEAKEKGPNGPCGPCSEIFFDYGVNLKCTSRVCDPDCSCGRFAEIWNLVFTQFERQEGGILKPLPNKNIDTGMGLERLVAVIQGKKSNYETDLFLPIIAVIKYQISYLGGSLSEERVRIIADHLRAITFAIADGVVPSNEGRGYVVRKLIITVADLFLQSGTKQPVYVFYFIQSVCDVMRDPYPELYLKHKMIINVVRKIEEAYFKVRKQRIPELENLNWHELSPSQRGEICFKYHDTYGLPLSAILEIIGRSGMTEEDIRKSIEFYYKEMEQQKKRSRASSKMTGDVFSDMQLELDDLNKTEFLGYEHTQSTSKIARMFIDNQKVHQAHQGDRVKLILDKTPFYAESGGQIGDTGYLTKDKNHLQIQDTQKIADIFIHEGLVEEGTFTVNDIVNAEINSDRRLSIMRNHTATHLLQAALREVLGSHVQQQGSLVAEDRLRFDFTHHQSILKEQLERIEETVNKHIASNEPVKKDVLSLKEAKERGALAFFAEKYKDTVRMITINEFSKELCGGTHLNSTGEIGQFKITAESSIAQGIRRLEARTANWAEQFVREKGREVSERTKADAQRQQEIEKKKENDEKNLMAFKKELPKIIENAETINGTKIVLYTTLNSDPNQLKQFSDLIRQQVSSVGICVGSTSTVGITVVVSTSGDLIGQGIKSNDIVKEIAPIMNGSGGGRPELAQAGSKDPAKLTTAMDKAREIFKKALSK